MIALLMAALLGALVSGGLYEFILVPRLWRIFERNIAAHTAYCMNSLAASHARMMACERYSAEHLTGSKLDD